MDEELFDLEVLQEPTTGRAGIALGRTADGQRILRKWMVNRQDLAGCRALTREASVSASRLLLAGVPYVRSANWSRGLVTSLWRDFVPGEQLAASLLSLSDVRSLGATLARFHCSGRPISSSGIGRSLPKYWLGNVFWHGGRDAIEALLQDLPPASGALVAQVVREIFARRDTLISPDAHPKRYDLFTLAHGDFTPSNIVRSNTSGSPSFWLIDLGEAFIGRPEVDIAMFLVSSSMPLPFAGAFIAGYCAEREARGWPLMVDDLLDEVERNRPICALQWHVVGALVSGGGAHLEAPDTEDTLAAACERVLDTLPG